MDNPVRGIALATVLGLILWALTAALLWCDPAYASACLAILAGGLEGL
jgi:hypothetical protein